MADFTIKQGDHLPEIQGTCKDADGNAVDLTSATGVTFHMVPSGGGAAKVNSAGAIVNAAGGIVKYSWVTADTDTVGTFDAEFEVAFTGPLYETFPNDSNISVEVVTELA